MEKVKFKLVWHGTRTKFEWLLVYLRKTGANLILPPDNFLVTKTGMIDYTWDKRLQLHFLECSMVCIHVSRIAVGHYKGFVRGYYHFRVLTFLLAIVKKHKLVMDKSLWLEKFLPCFN